MSGAIDRHLIKDIYQRLGNDELSKMIFQNRLLYSLTDDDYYIRKMLNGVPKVNEFYETMGQFEESGMVIFGAGNWGKQLSQLVGAKFFVDTKPKTSELGGLPVISYTDFINNYRNETIVISSRLYYEPMYHQLRESGVPSEKIINAGYLLNELSKQQYFDLQELRCEEKEVFVDVGSLDGMSSVAFLDWSKKSKEKIIYAFEPDNQNIIKVHDNLNAIGVNYKIVPKGCWSEETELHFHAKGNGNSMIDFQGEEIVEVTTIDKELQGERVTFIKMDIEGAEYEALCGAKDTITRNRPKLAISVYHKAEDIWEIPSIIMQYYQGYKFYLRHYSWAYSETVLYALP